MREILFRGKRADNGEWVKGYYYKSKYYRTDNELCDYITIPHPEEKYRGSDSYIVLSDTVGQYTGLLDKNGKKIFEGDIVKFKEFRDTYIGKVVFNQKTGGFEFWWNVTVGAYGEKATHTANLTVSNDIEVIGNIYDTPELLEVSK